MDIAGTGVISSICRTMRAMALEKRAISWLIFQKGRVSGEEGLGCMVLIFEAKMKPVVSLGTWALILIGGADGGVEPVSTWRRTRQAGYSNP